MTDSKDPPRDANHENHVCFPLPQPAVPFTPHVPTLLEANSSVPCRPISSPTTPTLIPIQPPPQIPRLPHQLLIFMLLHLEFPLPLHTNQPPDLPLVLPIKPCFPSLLPFPHPRQKRLPRRRRKEGRGRGGRGRTHVDQRYFVGCEWLGELGSARFCGAG